MIADPYELIILNRKQQILSPLVIAGLLVLAACSDPPPQQGNAQSFPIRAVVAKVIQGPIEESLFLVGSLTAKEFIDIRSEIEAEVTYVGFQEGAVVEKGTVLFRLDDNKLQAQVAEAKARRQLAKLDFERGKILLVKKTISQQQFDQFRFELDAAEASLRLSQVRMNDAIIVASFSGRMDERQVSLGQFVNIGELLSSLVQTNPIEVEFNVPERYMAQVSIGQIIKIKSVAYLGEDFYGDVMFISPQLDERNRTVLMKADIDNEDGRLKPGMFANLELIFNAREDAIVIPEQAISYQGDQASIVVVDADGKAEFRNIEVGLRQSGVAEILSGLSADEIIVVEGLQKISPGRQIMISPKSEKYGVKPPTS